VKGERRKVKGFFFPGASIVWLEERGLLVPSALKRHRGSLSGTIKKGGGHRETDGRLFKKASLRVTIRGILKKNVMTCENHI
jgi:hypothetical protein